PPGSLRSTWHFGSKFGQACAEHAVPWTGTRRRSAIAMVDGCWASWACVGAKSLAAGAAVMAKAIAPATSAAAAILTIGLLKIGLSILSPIHPLDEHADNARNG